MIVSAESIALNYDHRIQEDEKTIEDLLIELSRIYTNNIVVKEIKVLEAYISSDKWVMDLIEHRRVKNIHELISFIILETIPYNSLNEVKLYNYTIYLEIINL